MVGKKNDLAPSVCVLLPVTRLPTRDNHDQMFKTCCPRFGGGGDCVSSRMCLHSNKSYVVHQWKVTIIGWVLLATTQAALAEFRRSIRPRMGGARPSRDGFDDGWNDADRIGLFLLTQSASPLLRSLLLLSAPHDDREDEWLMLLLLLRRTCCCEHSSDSVFAFSSGSCSFSDRRRSNVCPFFSLCNACWKCWVWSWLLLDGDVNVGTGSDRFIFLNGESEMDAGDSDGTLTCSRRSNNNRFADAGDMTRFGLDGVDGTSLYGLYLTSLVRCWKPIIGVSNEKGKDGIACMMAVLWRWQSISCCCR